MAAKSITTELVQNLWAVMTKYYGTNVKTKQTSFFMKFIAFFLNLFGVQKKDDFLNNYTTTIGHTIYIPFTLGVEEGDWTFYQQLLVCIHEHQHIVQKNNDGAIKFTWNYLLSPTCRAAYEAEAYSTDIELHWYYDKKIPNTHELAILLTAYSISPNEISEMENYLNARAVRIQDGEYINQATRIAMTVL
jgi:hypothetical protein